MFDKRTLKSGLREDRGWVQKKQDREGEEKTRPFKKQFQDCCKNWSLNPFLSGCKKDVMMFISFKAQTTKIEFNRFRKHCRPRFAAFTWKRN